MGTPRLSVRVLNVTPMGVTGVTQLSFVDLGPGAGHEGGHVVFQGTPADLVATRSTLTGRHLAEYVGA